MFYVQLCNSQGKRGIKQVKYIIKELYKKGTRTIAKTLLKSQRDDALDTDTLHEFERAMTESGLPANVEELVDSTYPEVPSQVFMVFANFF